MNFRWSCLLFVAAIPFVSDGQVLAPVVTATNTTIRVVASNLSSGNNQQYEAPGIRILQGLKPDIVAIQEFNSSGSIRTMVDTTFGTNFVYYRESGAGYTIPNGVISRYPIISSGSWVDSDTGVNDRGFAWARIDVPGTNDLYVVSVHLKASGDSVARRNAQATEIKSLIQSNFPANAWIILGGDFNTGSRTEPCMTNFATRFSDSRVPVDHLNDYDTNLGRNDPYDYVLASHSFNSNQVATVLGATSFVNGLVFDSRIYTPLPSPVQSGDSEVSGMQHMAVVKDFRIDYTVTNYVTVASPQLRLLSTNVLGWSGHSNLTYTVQTSSNLTAWSNAATATSSSTNYSFTVPSNVPRPSFYRVRYP